MMFYFGEDVLVPAALTDPIVTINYALQTFDRGNNQDIKRYASDSRSEITKNKVPESMHIVYIIDDGSTDDTVEWLKQAISTVEQNNVKLILTFSNNIGVMGSIKKCYEYLRDSAGDLVYQVQDDYLFNETAIFECVDMFMQISRDVNVHPIISPYNDTNLWQSTYRYTTTPRMIVAGINGYWIQMYDTSCSFLTSRVQFNQHWDLYEKFFNHAMDNRLEADTLNKIFVERSVLGLSKFNSCALHMQSDLEKDPYINWKDRWDSISEL